PMESIETLRQTELDGLDLAESALAERIRAGELRAIETMLKIKHQRARLTGLYAAGLDTALDSELVAIQTTIHALRMAKTYPDMSVEEIVTQITTTTLQ